MWLIVLSLPTHNLHELFSYILSILDLIWLVITSYHVLLLEEIQFLFWGFRFFSHVPRFYRVRFQLLVTWKRPLTCFFYFPFVFFWLFFVLWLFMFIFFSWWLQSVFPCSCLCNLFVLVWKRQRYRQCWQDFSSFFLTHLISQRHLWDVRLDASS